MLNVRNGDVLSFIFFLLHRKGISLLLTQETAKPLPAQSQCGEQSLEHWFSTCELKPL